MFRISALCIFSWLLVQLHQVRSDDRPNFIVIVASDQDLELTNVSQYMPNVNKYLINEGISFSNSYVNTPSACASRCELLSGKYFQNIGSPNGTCERINDGNILFGNDTLFQTLHSNGYQTGLFGFATNDNNQFFCPVGPTYTGFTRLSIPCVFGDYYCQTYFNLYQGSIISRKTYPNITEDVYQTAILGNNTVS